MPDASRAYRSGVTQVSLNTARAALETAFVAAMAADGYDAPITTAIRRAQDAVRDAQAHGAIDWNERSAEGTGDR